MSRGISHGASMTARTTPTTLHILYLLLIHIPVLVQCVPGEAVVTTLAGGRDGLPGTSTPLPSLFGVSVCPCGCTGQLDCSPVDDVALVSDYAAVRSLPLHQLQPVVRTIIGGAASGRSISGVLASSSLVSGPFRTQALPRGHPINGGGVLIADSSNNRILQLLMNGSVVTVCGGNSGSVTAEGALCSTATMQYPYGIAACTDTASSSNKCGNYSSRPVNASVASPLLMYAESNAHRVRIIFNDSTVYTVAGSGSGTSGGNGGPATAAGVQSPTDVELDALGNAYIPEQYAHTVRRVNLTSGIITNFAGTGSYSCPTASTAFNATSTSIGGPIAVTVARGTNIVYIACTCGVVVSVTQTGNLTVVAGNPTAGSWAPPGTGMRVATAIILTGPQDIALTNDGGMLIAESSSYIGVRRVWANGSSTIIVGVYGAYMTNPDGIPAISASLNGPLGVTVGMNDSVVFSVSSSAAVRFIDGNGTLRTVAGIAGSQSSTTPPQPGVATSTQLSRPSSVAWDAHVGVYYIADNAGYVASVDRNGTLRVVAGTGGGLYFGDNVPATTAVFNAPSAVLELPNGTLVVADSRNNRVRTVFNVSGDAFVRTIMGTGAAWATRRTEGVAALNYTLQPMLLAYQASTDTLYISTASCSLVALYTNGTAAAVVNSQQSCNPPVAGAASPFPALSTYICSIGGLVALPDGSIMFGTRSCAFTPGAALYQLMLNGSLVQHGVAGMNGPVTVLTLMVPLRNYTWTNVGNIAAFTPTSNAFDWRIYVIDATRYLRVVYGNGSVAPLAGHGTQAYTIPTPGAKNIALADLYLVSDVYLAVSQQTGHVYALDTWTSLLLLLNVTSLFATVVLGAGPTTGYSLHGFPANMSLLASPAGIYITPRDDVWFADAGNNVIRLWNASTGRVTRVAGSSLDGGSATSTTLLGSLVVAGGTSAAGAAAGNVFVAGASRFLHRVWPDGTLTIVLGDGLPRQCGAADSVRSVNAIAGIAWHPDGDRLCFTEPQCGRIACYSFASASLTTLMGGRGQGTSRTSPQVQAIADVGLSNPIALAFDATGSILYFSDTAVNTIRIFFANGTVGTLVASNNAASGGRLDDGASGSAAWLMYATSLAVDARNGRLLVVDSTAARVRAISPLPVLAPSVSPSVTPTSSRTISPSSRATKTPTLTPSRSVSFSPVSGSATRGASPSVSASVSPSVSASVSTTARPISSPSSILATPSADGIAATSSVRVSVRATCQVSNDSLCIVSDVLPLVSLHAQVTNCGSSQPDVVCTVSCAVANDTSVLPPLSQAIWPLLVSTDASVRVPRIVASATMTLRSSGSRQSAFNTSFVIVPAFAMTNASSLFSAVVGVCCTAASSTTSTLPRGGSATDCIPVLHAPGRWPLVGDVYTVDAPAMLTSAYTGARNITSELQASAHALARAVPNDSLALSTYASIMDIDSRVLDARVQQRSLSMTVIGAPPLTLVAATAMNTSFSLVSVTRVVIGAANASIIGKSVDGRYLHVAMPALAAVCPAAAMQAADEDAIECGYTSMSISWENNQSFAPVALTLICPPACPGVWAGHDVLPVSRWPASPTLTLVHPGTPLTAADFPAGMGLFLTQSCARLGYTDPRTGACTNISDPRFGSCAFGASRSCSPCPNGGICPGGSRVWAQPGFYAPAERIPLVQACAPPKQRCLGYNASVGGSTCDSMYAPLSFACTACASGFYTATDGTCVACPATDSVTAYVRPLSITLGACAAIVVVIYSMSWIIARAVGGSVSGGAKRLLALGVWTIAVLQLIAQAGTAIPPDTPAPVRAVYASLLGFQLQGVALPSGCTPGFAFTSQVVQMSIVLALEAAAVVLFVVLSKRSPFRRLAHCCKAGGTSRRDVADARTPVMLARIAPSGHVLKSMRRTIVPALTLLYPVVVNSVVALLHCEPAQLTADAYAALDGDGRTLGATTVVSVMLLASDTSRVCYEGSHATVAPLAWVCGVLYVVAFPITVTLAVAAAISRLLTRYHALSYQEACAQDAQDVRYFVDHDRASYMQQAYRYCCMCLVGRRMALRGGKRDAACAVANLIDASTVVREHESLSALTAADTRASMHEFHAYDRYLLLALVLSSHATWRPMSLPPAAAHAAIVTVSVTVAAWMYLSRSPFHTEEAWKAQLKLASFAWLALASWANFVTFAASYTESSTLLAAHVGMGWLLVVGTVGFLVTLATAFVRSAVVGAVREEREAAFVASSNKLSGYSVNPLRVDDSSLADVGSAPGASSASARQIRRVSVVQASQLPWLVKHSQPRPGSHRSRGPAGGTEAGSESATDPVAVQRRLSLDNRRRSSVDGRRHNSGAERAQEGPRIQHLPAALDTYRRVIVRHHA